MRKLTCEVRSAGSEGTEYLPSENYGIDFCAEETGKNEFSHRCVIRIRNGSDRDFLGVIHVKLLEEKKDPKFFLPGYLYDRNTAELPSSGRKAFPRLKEDPRGMPESSYWMTRSDRLAEPMSLVYDEGHIWGLAAAPYWIGDRERKEAVQLSHPGKFYQFSGFSCNLCDRGCASVGYSLGYENAPWLFVQTAKVCDRADLTEENCFLLKRGETVSFEMIVYDYRGASELSVLRAIEDAYFRFHQPPRTIPDMTIPKALTLLSGAVRDEAWLEEEKMYSGFVYDREKGTRYNPIFSLSWTNGLSVVTPMLMAANYLGDEKARRQCLLFLEEVVPKCMNEKSGLLNDAIDSVRGWWYDGMHSGGHSGYINGQAVYYLLKAFLSERDHRGIVHEQWLHLVKRVIEKLNREKNSDGEYPFTMSGESGAGIEYDSLGSAWCLAATVLYAQITSDGSYDDGMRRSEQHYYDRFVSKMVCYGGPLDTDKAVDSEGILAYIRAVKLMHQRFGEERYLRHLRDGVGYETTFKLGYNTPVQVRPLSEIGWSSCGGSITSVANPHIHPMSSTILPELKYLAEQSGDPYVRSRWEDTLLWSLQTFNTRDREYGYGKAGWMSERFCFCQGLLTETYSDGAPASTWFALMPWASASIIEGLCGIADQEQAEKIG